jgi:hypothetical protein
MLGCKDSQYILWKCAKIQIFGNWPVKTALRADYDRGILATIRSKIFCLRVYYLKIWRLKYTGIGYNLSCCSIWVWNLVSHNEGRMSVRVFQKKLLRKTFVPKRDGVIRESTEWHNELFHYLRSHKTLFSDQITKNDVDRICSVYGKEEKCQKVFGGETWIK